MIPLTPPKLSFVIRHADPKVIVHLEGIPLNFSENPVFSIRGSFGFLGEGSLRNVSGQLDTAIKTPAFTYPLTQLVLEEDAISFTDEYPVEKIHQVFAQVIKAVNAHQGAALDFLAGRVSIGSFKPLQE